MNTEENSSSSMKNQEERFLNNPTAVDIAPTEAEKDSCKLDIIVITQLCRGKGTS